MDSVSICRIYILFCLIWAPAYAILSWESLASMYPPYREQNVPCDERTKSTEQKIMQAADRETQVTSIYAYWCLFRYCLLGGATGQFWKFVLNLRIYRVMENKKKTVFTDETKKEAASILIFRAVSSFRHHSITWLATLLSTFMLTITKWSLEC
jgi:hypothetical protein